jgi:hypothetical protein
MSSMSGGSSASGSASWGGITGTIANQNDLQVALNAKATLTQGWNKITRTKTDFSVAAASVTNTLLSVAANTLVDAVFVYVNTIFDDGLGNAPGIDTFGFSGNGDLYGGFTGVSLNTTGLIVGGDNGNGGNTKNFVASSINNVAIFSGGTIPNLNSASNLTVTLTASVNFNTFTQGQVTFYIHTTLLP